MPSSSAAPVVLLHGGGLGAWSWRGVMEPLRDSFELLAPTLQGHDQRDGVFDMASSIEEIADLLKDLGSAHLVGLSLGGQLALGTAAAHPELVRSLLVTGANIHGVPMWSLTAPTIKLSAPMRSWGWMQKSSMKMFGVTEERDQADYRRASSTMDGPRLLAVMEQSHLFRLPHGLASVQAPAAILRGEREAKVIKQSVPEVAAAIPGATSAVVAKAQHPWPMQQPERFAKVLQHWLDHAALPPSI